jgi:hypothetical protein
MGLWPFGREPADVESASRIVTTIARDGRTVRAKLTINFKEPQTQAAADEAADRCSQATEALFREVPGHEQLLGHEEEVTSTLLQRLPPGLPPIRVVEVAAIHVVGDPGSIARRRPSNVPASGAGSDPHLPPLSAPYPPSSIPYPPASGTLPPAGPASASLHGPGTTHPPPSSVSARRRTTSSSMRAISAALVPAWGSPPADIGAALSPLLRDATTRLLLGFLRTHDLVMVRCVMLDEAATELLASLLPVSEAPPGEFEASRAMEIGRWRSTLGADVLEALRDEAAALSVSLASLALQRIGIVPAAALEVLHGLCRGAFPGDDGSYVQRAARYIERELNADAARSVAAILGHPSPEPITLAIAPLLEAVADDLDVMAQIAKVTLGLPS